MKILKGSKRGRVLESPPEVKGNSNLTPSLLKEATFQILESRLPVPPGEYAFFDLCSGSGQIGFEAFSMGFGSVHLAEVDSSRFSFLVEQVRRLGFRIELHRKDFRRMTGKILDFEKAVIFLDPPYSFWVRDRCESIEKFIESLLQKRAGSANRELLLVVQGPEKLNLDCFGPETESPFSAVDSRDYRKNWINWLVFPVKK